ncbi:hypothetical protein Syun_017828 [Stephania yunnanensis]|uniref:Uncharacterized protein n=1 Tax=Stephania yunnanensis TaxID=152371 RepID=A0AAP0J9Y5_9MAGN
MVRAKAGLCELNVRPQFRFSGVARLLGPLRAQDETGAMPTTGTRGGRQIPQTTSYRKSKQLSRVTDVVDADTFSAHSLGSSSSDSSEEERVQVEEGNMEEGKENT